MAINGSHDIVAESGRDERNPGASRFSLAVENERTVARRDGRSCLARPNPQARTGTGKNIFPVHLITSRVGNHAQSADRNNQEE